MKNICLLLILVSGLQLAIAANDTDCGTAPAICWLIGDPHIRKFNGNEYLFSISGKILALSDRKSVWIRLAVKKTERASVITDVYIDFIYQDGSKYGRRSHVHLTDDPDHVMINHRIRHLPYTKYGVQVNKVTFGILVDFDGVHIKWLSSAKLFVVLGTQFAGKVEGECGLYCSAPPGKGHSTARKTYSRAVLTLYRPYNDNDMLEDRIRQVMGKHLAEVKVIDSNDIHTSLVLNITMLENIDMVSTEDIEEEIRSKLMEGKDKDGNTLSDLLKDPVEDVKFEETGTVYRDTDFPLPDFILAEDEMDDNEDYKTY